jgi:hypothetical protein
MLGYVVCQFIGGVLYQFNQSARANIELNLRRIMGSQTPPAEIKRRTRLTFNTILYNYFDLFRLPFLDDATVNHW